MMQPGKELRKLRNKFGLWSLPASWRINERDDSISTRRLVDAAGGKAAK